MNTPGQSTVAATLDAIDAATEQRCACGCGQPLTEDGPSAWFASEWCQQRWTGRRADDDPPSADPLGGLFTAMAEQMAATQRDMIQQLYGIAAGALGVDVWPSGAQAVRIYTGGGASEIGTLTPDPDGDVTMPSGRYTFTPRLCPEHARQAQADPPTDPMERALWLRRNRHTGPRQPQRAPRRIDPRRNR